uniref:Rab3 GTPase-activating protein regulatory subunit n=1 Tax=Ascaris suum TaxID=6253 RepID=F1KQS4_ASCSU
MCGELRAIGCLSSEQLSSIQSFLLSEATSSQSNADEASEGEEDGDSLMADAERQAGVFEWSDFGAEDTVKNDLRTPLERKNSAEYRKTAKWLQNALIGIAGNADIIVLALVQRVAVLERVAADDGRYKLIAEFSASDGFSNNSVYIRCMCVLPMGCGSRKTETSAYDWVAIAVGLSSGHVRFFTEHGVLLRSEHVSYKPIDAIRLGRSIKPGNQELAILSAGKITVVEGLSLFVALKAAKSQVARGEPDLDRIAASVPINFENLKLDVGQEASDFAVVGPLKPAWFDLYANASLSHAGFKATCERTALPVYSTYLFAGRAPFVSFGWNQEGGSSPSLITDTIYSFGSQIGSSVVSSLPSWGIRSYLGIGVSRKDRTPTAPIPANKSSINLATRSVLLDGGREGERIFPSSREFNLFAVTDSIARVVLIEAASRQITRMWKGYRDARCAWIEASSSIESEVKLSKGKTQATALFLVIFAPRRGLLEVWSMQNGRRVSAVNVDRRGRLVGVPRLDEQLLGCSATAFSAPSSAFFLTPSGLIFEVSARFRMALWDESMATLHDHNILREMRQLGVKPSEEELAAWIKLMYSLKTTTAFNEAVDILLKERQVQIGQLAHMTNVIREFFDSHSKMKGSTPGRALMARLATLSQLFDAYAHLQALNTEPRNRTRDEGADDQEQQLSSRFKLSEAALKLCVKRIADCSVQCGGDVEEPLSVFDFLGHFMISSGLSTSADSSEEWREIRIRDYSPRLGGFIFCAVLTGQCSIEHFSGHTLSLLPISETDLLELFCAYWLNPPEGTPVFYLPRVLSVCEKMASSATDLSQWLELARQRITDSSRIAEALSLCLIMRAVAVNLTGSLVSEDQGEDDKSREDKDGWDKVELGSELWDLHLRHLQCMALMSTLPNCPSMRTSDLLSAGCAYYREQVGKWAAMQGEAPGEVYAALLGKQCASVEQSGWYGTIGELSSLLPLSLKAELVMCDCAWECMSAWFKEREKNFTLYEHAIEYVSILEELPRLQHGMCLLLWESFLHEPLMDAYNLLNKTGHFPRERHLRREIGLSDSQLITFVSGCRRILTTLCNAVRHLDHYVDRRSAYEDFICVLSQMSSQRQSAAREPLSELASRQKAVNYHLVLHHVHLTSVIELQLSVCDEDENLKPCTLFDEVGVRALFAPFHTHPLIPIADVPDTVKRRRQLFLEKCVTMLEDARSCYRERWTTIVELASDWHLDVDALRIKEIVKLYLEQRIGDAERLIPVVEGRGELADSLFKLCVANFRSYIAATPQVLTNAERLSLVTNRLSTCLSSVATDVVVSCTPSREVVTSLLKHVGTLLATSSASNVRSQQIALVGDMEQLLCKAT